MISNYSIEHINGDDRLILYLNLSYEFGGNSGIKKSFKQVIKEYIWNNKINFHGGIITFVVGGVMIGNVVFNNNEFKDYKPIYTNNYVSNVIVEKTHDVRINDKIDNKKTSLESNEDKIVNASNKEDVIMFEIKNVGQNVNTNDNVVNNNISIDSNNNSVINSNKKDDSNKIKAENTMLEEIQDNNTYIKLQKKDGSVIKIELEEYLIGVVGAEMPALFNIEALKTQAIIARTYALKANLNGKILKDNESNQSYKTNEELEKMWGGNFEEYYAKVKKAVNETEGMVLVYNGNYIEAVYHSTSNGMTESSVNVWGNYYPYLVSVSSQYDNLNVSFVKNVEFSYQELSNKLGFNIDRETIIELNGKTSGNRIESVKVLDHVYKGIDFRNILGLRSADFDIEYTDNGIIFTTRGYGHGVGLSQYGANGMAKNGYNYETILKHYYPGANLIKRTG